VELQQLLAAVADGPAFRGAALVGDGGVDVVTVEHDSRRVEPGALFCCVPGERADGHDFAAAAAEQGAVALLCEHPVGVGVPELQVPSVRAAMGPVAAEVNGRPSDTLAVVGVTGTNGKTTTTHLLRSILEAGGWPTDVIGTLTGARTTPEAPELQQELAQSLARGRRAVAMEVSSHALAQHRVDGTTFRVAVFTNLSRDHLDFHGTMAEYFKAKALLFEPALSQRAVVNLDDPNGRLLRDAASIPTVGYSLEDTSEVVADARGTTLTWKGARLHVPLAGSFNVENALAAATAALELGLPIDAVRDGLAAAGNVAGRFEVVDQGQPFLVVVDYAHTPDGLARLLEAARPLATSHQVILVFGAGGNRDRAKRPLMGEMASRGADRVVLTSDNPRDEDPLAIIDAVKDGMQDTSGLVVEPDRRAAIAEALALAHPGDVVVVAGKGHETTQTIGTSVLPFDDRTVTRELLTTLAGGAGA
jgi:UDP-N-acetylmuramoyl-L-alanyl-D-glutamate--2,6-diaminopimelate ligase